MQINILNIKWIKDVNVNIIVIKYRRFFYGIREGY